MKALSIIGCSVFVAAAISAGLMFKAIKALEIKEFKADLDFCDGSLCDVCPGYKKCGGVSEKK